MEEIEYLEEYEDLILPTIQSNSGEVDGFQTSRSSNMMQDEDSSSIDQDIFESLFDDHSDDESSNILQKKADPKLSQRGSDGRASLDSLDMLVKDLVGEQNSQKKQQSTKTNTNTSISTSKPSSQLQKKMSTSTPSSSSAIGRALQKAPTSSSSSSLLKSRPSGGSLTKIPMSRSSIGFQKSPGSNSSHTSSMLTSSSQKLKSSLSHGARIDMQHKFDQSKSVATVRPTVQQKQQQNQQQQRRFSPGGLNRNLPSSSASSSRSSSGLVTLSARKNMSMPSNRGGPSPRGGPTTRGGMAPRQFNRPQTTIVKPEKREIKDPSEDPLSLDDIAEALLDSDSDSFSLSDISDESLDSMSDLEEDSQNVIDISNDSSIGTKNNRKELENIRRDTPSPTVSDVDKDDNSLSPLQAKFKSNKVEAVNHPNKPIAKTHNDKQNVPSLLGDDFPMVPKKPASEKVTIISDTLLTRIDTALLDTALMDTKKPTENEYTNQTNEDVVAALERELMPFLKKNNSKESVEEDAAQKPTEESDIPTDTTNSKNILDELAEAVFGIDNDIIEDKSNEKLDKRHSQLDRADSNRSNLEADVLNVATEQENTDNLNNNKDNPQAPADQNVESNTIEEAEVSTINESNKIIESNDINESNDIIEESHVEYDEFNDQLDDEVAMEVEVETIKDAETENVDEDIDMDLNNTVTTSEQQTEDNDADDEGTVEEDGEGSGEIEPITTKKRENVEQTQTVQSHADETNEISKDKEDTASTSSNEKFEDGKTSLPASVKRNIRKRCATSESSSSEKSVSTKPADSIKKVFKEPVNPCNSPTSKESTNASRTTFRKRNLRSPALNEKSRGVPSAPPAKRYKLDTENIKGRSSRSTDTSESELEATESIVSKTTTKTDSNEEETNKSTENNSSLNTKTSKIDDHKPQITESETVRNQVLKEKDTHSQKRSKIITSSIEASTNKDDDVNKKGDNLHKNTKEDKHKADNRSTPSKQVVTKSVSSHSTKPLVLNKPKSEATKNPTSDKTIKATEKEETPTKFPKMDRTHTQLKVMVSKCSTQSTTTDASTNKDKTNKQPEETTKETIVTPNKDDTSKIEENQQHSDMDETQASSHAARKLKLKRFTTNSEKDLDKTRKDSEKSSADEAVDKQHPAKESDKPTTAINEPEVETITNAVDKEVVEKKSETPTKKLPSTRTKTDDGESKNIKEQTVETSLTVSQQKESAVEEQHAKTTFREESTERNAAAQKKLENVARTTQKQFHGSKTQVKTNETQEEQATQEEANEVHSTQKSAQPKPAENPTTTASTKDVLKSEKQQHEEENKKNIEKQPEGKQSELSEKDAVAVAAAVKLQNKDSNNSLNSQKVSENVVTRRVAGKQIKTAENTAIKASLPNKEGQPKQQVKKVELVEAKKKQAETGSVKTDEPTKATPTNEKPNITVTKAVNKNAATTISSSVKNTQSVQSLKAKKEQQELQEVAAKQKKSETTTQAASSVKETRTGQPAKAAVTSKRPQATATQEEQAGTKKPEATRPVSSAKVTKVVAPSKTKEGQEPKQYAASQRNTVTTSQPDSSTKEVKAQELKPASAANQNKPGATQQPKQAQAACQKQSAVTQPISKVKEAKSVVPSKATPTQKKPQAATHTSNVKESKNTESAKDKEDKELNPTTQNQSKSGKILSVSSAKEVKEQEEKQSSESLNKKPHTTAQASNSSEAKCVAVPAKVGVEEKVLPARTATTQKREQTVSRAKEVKEPTPKQISDSSQKAEPTQQTNSAKKALTTKSTEQEELTRHTAASEAKPNETATQEEQSETKTPEATQPVSSAIVTKVVALPKTKEGQEPKKAAASQNKIVTTTHPDSSTKEVNKAQELKPALAANQNKPGATQEPKIQEEPQTEELKQIQSSLKQVHKGQEKQDLQESTDEKHKVNVVEKNVTTESPVPIRKSLRTKVLAENEEGKPTVEASQTTLATPTINRVDTEKVIHSHGTRKAIKLRVADTPPLPLAPTPTQQTLIPSTTTLSTTTQQTLIPPQHIHGTRNATKAKLVQEHQTVSSASKAAASVTAQNTVPTPTTTQQKDLPAVPTKEVEPKKHEITPAVTRRSFKLLAAKSPEKQPEIVASVRTYLGRSTETTRKMLIQSPSQAVKSKSTGSLSFKEWKENQKIQSNSKQLVESTTKTNDTTNEHDKLDTSVELVLDVATNKNETLAKTSKVSNELNIDLDMSEDNKHQTQITTQSIIEMVQNLDNSTNTKLDNSKASSKNLCSAAVATSSSEVQNKNIKELCNETENDDKEKVPPILEDHSDTKVSEAETNTSATEEHPPKVGTNSSATKDIKENATKTTLTAQSLPKKKRIKSELDKLMESLPKFLDSSIYSSKRRRRDVYSLSPTRAAADTSPKANSTQFKTPNAPPTAKSTPTADVIDPAVNPFKGAGTVISTVTRMETRTAPILNKSYPLKVLDMSPVKANPFATATLTTTTFKKAEPVKILPENIPKAVKIPEKLHKCRKVRVRINRTIFRNYQRALLLRLRSKVTKPAQTHLQGTAPKLSVKFDDEHLPADAIAAEENIDNSLAKLCHTLNALSAPDSTVRACSTTPSQTSLSQASNKNLLEANATTAEVSASSRTAIIQNDSEHHHLRSSGTTAMNELAMSPHIRHPIPDNVCLPEITQEENQQNSSGTVSAQEDGSERISPNDHLLHGDDSLLTPLKSSNQASEMALQQQQQQQQQKRSVRLQQQSTLKQIHAATLQTQQQQIATKPISTLQHKQHQQGQGLFAPIVPKKEFEEDSQTPAVQTTTASGNLAATPPSSLLSGGVPAAIVDNSGTRLYSFLHPSKYNRSHGAVLLDYCCPNLDGPMPAIDPTREHAQLQSLVRELPAYIVMTTKVVTRADLEAKNNSIPASIRKKMEKLTSVAAAASTAAAANRTPTLQALIAKGPQPPPAPTHPIAATAVPTITTQMPSGAPIYTSNISALQKQLPATTTLTPKMPPMGLPESLPPLTPFSALSSAAHGGGAAASASRPPLKPEFMRAVLRSNLRRFDTMLQKYRNISELTYVDRQRIIDGIVHQTTFSSQDVEQATRLLEEYYQFVNGMPVAKSAVSITTTPTVNTATPTTVSTTPTAYAASSVNLSTSLTPTHTVAAQQLEQIHANSVQKSRTAVPTTLQAKRQVPIYDKDRNIIGYQMHNVPSVTASSTNSTLSTRVGIMSSTRQRLSNPATGTPTSALKQPAQESPRIFYTKPMQTSTPIANNNTSTSAAYEAASRLSRSVTIRQVPTKPTPQLNNSSPRMPILSKMPNMPNMAGKHNPLSNTPRIASITVSNPTTPNTVTTKTNVTHSSSSLAPTITKRITRHTATTREGQILIITKDQDGIVATGTPANNAESILPDEERSAAELKEIKREKEDEGFIGAS